MEKATPVAPAAPVPPKDGGGSGRGVGCAIGCLIIVLIILLILSALIGTGYYLLFMGEKEPGSYFDVDKKAEETVKCDTVFCLEENLKKCALANGETEIGEFAEVEFEILGQSGDFCVVYVEVTELKEIPSQLKIVPDFILEKLLENLTLECLIPERVYTQGIEEVGDYIGENLQAACKGPLFDLMDKFGIEIEEFKL